MLRNAGFPLAILTASCAPPSSNSGPAPAPPATLTFEMKTRESTFQGCIAGSEGCTYIRFDYPAITGAPADAAVEVIGEAIQSFLLKPLQPDAAPQGVDALMDAFLEDYRSFKAADPRSVQSWFVERKAFVLRNSPQVLSLSFRERTYFGGAQPYDAFHFANVDPGTGTRLALDDVLQDGAREKLIAMAEARFRERRAIPEGTSLKAAGFTFENDAFALTENFALREDGIAFHYNASDVAPPALGPTEILLTFPELGELVKPEYGTGGVAPVPPPS